MNSDTEALQARIRELESKVRELEAQNLDLEREVARRGVKLSCTNIALARAKIHYDEQAQHREEAVQDIAHDLRTPLTSIRGAAQNVLDGIAGPLDPGVKTYVEIVRDQSQRLIGVVNWLLQAIRITSQPRSLEIVSQDLSELLRAVVTNLTPIADERGIALSLATVPITACFDQLKLHQVFDNLIGNALKFTDPGGKVHVRLEDRDDHVLITIADTGIGMSAEALQRIFHRYYRVDAEREGSGLGLLIARELVRLHGGDITVASELGQGSTFSVRLPKAQEQAESDMRATG
jgi:two-component system, OmpR family, phosphate regulon sensor histidine kinase PhoR